MPDGRSSTPASLHQRRREIVDAAGSEPARIADTASIGPAPFEQAGGNSAKKPSSRSRLSRTSALLRGGDRLAVAQAR